MRYEILELLGAGGMGQVYRARDLSLGREIALKILRGNDPEIRERAQREARHQARIAHPNVGHVYEVGDLDGKPFVAMQLIDGQTLDIVGKEMTLTEKVDVIRQVAEGVQAAHEQGLIHRDLKPGNVLVERRDDGWHPWVVDFGLALDPSQAGLTATGVMVGTAAYMAPEQIRGERSSLDQRTDVYALGATFFELLTGRAPFVASNPVATIMKAMSDEAPPLRSLDPRLPIELGHVVTKCLEKDPARRYSSARSLADDLARFLHGEPVLAQAPSLALRLTKALKRTLSTGRGATLIASGAMLIALGAVIMVLVMRPQTPGGEHSPSEAIARRAELLHSRSDAILEEPTLSPDGSLFAYVALEQDGTDLWLAPVEGGVHRQITHDGARKTAPAFSPDSARIAFARHGDEVEIYVVPTTGGVPELVIAGAEMPAWAPGGDRIAFLLRRPDKPQALASTRLDGTEFQVHLEADSSAPFLFDPAWAPNGRELAFRRGTGGLAGELWIVNLENGEQRQIGDDPPTIYAHEPVFTADGKALIHISNRSGARNLWSIPIDGGAPKRLTSGAGPDTGPSIAADGSILMLNSRWRYNLRLHSLESGETRELMSHAFFVWAPCFTDDGHEVVFSRATPDGVWNLWSVPTEGGQPRALLESQRGAIYGRTAPNGEIFFTTWDRPRSVMRWSPGSGPATSVLPVGLDAAYADPSPDGRRIAFAGVREHDERLLIADLESGEHDLLLSRSGAVPRWSPDGEWIAFSGDRSVSQGVFRVRADGSGLERLTTSGGWPVWWPNGERLGYLAQTRDDNQEIRILDLNDGTTEVLQLKFSGLNHPFDIDPTGKTIVTSNSVHTSSEIWILRPN